MLESEGQMNHPKQRQNLFKSLVFVVTRLYCDVTPDLEEQLLNFVIKDQKNRADLMLIWLGELYDQSKGFSCCVKNSEENVVFSEAENNARYDAVMVNALSRLFAQKQHKEA